MEPSKRLYAEKPPTAAPSSTVATACWKARCASTSWKRPRRHRVRAGLEILIVNFDHVRRCPYLNARLELVLSNGESVIASRQYAPAIKQKIGL